MTGIVITQVSGKNYFKVTMNDYASAVGFEYIHFWKDEILSVQKDLNNDYISIQLLFSQKPYRLSFDSQPNSMICDSVLGSAPTSIDDLAIKISDIRN